MKKIAALMVVLLVLATEMEKAEPSSADCDDACSTACVNRDPRLSGRCELKCQIKCGPDGLVTETGRG